MAKIPFDIKYKPLIESGEYKVVTGDDRPVKIICWDKKVYGGRFEIVGLVPTPQRDTEAIQLYCPDGTLIASVWNEKLKLFIVTPEPELSEFEKKLSDVVGYAISLSVAEPQKSTSEFAKEYASELLALAKKEIGTIFDKAGEYLRGRNDGIEYGKAEALKDLPRWEKCASCDEDKATIPAWIVRFDAERANKSVVVHDGYYICFGDLEKLPGFKED